ncbi:hypothetical protein V1511DRAFT_502944 [Dipodascopsis uninucleata]
MFKFEFSGDDIEDSNDVMVYDCTAEGAEGTRMSGVGAASVEYGLTSPQLYDISQMLFGLPSRISYSLIADYAGSKGARNLPIPRREVFDIKTQIMASEDSVINGAFTDGSARDLEKMEFMQKELQLLLSNTEDLRTEIYEGGLKSWEGAGDLTTYLANRDVPIGEGVIELGCGSAMPIVYLFQKYISEILSSPQQNHRDPVNFIAADYNYSVLRLMTAPNFLLAYANAKSSVTPSQVGDVAFDLDDPQELVLEFLDFLQTNNIAVCFISGSWDSTKFKTLLKFGMPGALNFSLVLASETIYSVSSLSSFSTLVLDSIRHWDDAASHDSHANAIIACKEIYFGVGGTLRQFIEILKQKGGSTEVLERIIGRGNSGIARMVISVQAH